MALPYFMAMGIKALKSHLKAALRIAAEMSSARGRRRAPSLARDSSDAENSIQYSRGLVLALVNDQPVPVSLFKPWCSYSKMWMMQKEGRLKMHLINRKACVIPSEFFACWATMTDNAR